MTIKHQRFQIADSPEPDERKRFPIASLILFALLAIGVMLAYFYFQ